MIHARRVDFTIPSQILYSFSLWSVWQADYDINLNPKCFDHLGLLEVNSKAINILIIFD